MLQTIAKCTQSLVEGGAMWAGLVTRFGETVKKIVVCPNILTVANALFSVSRSVEGGRYFKLLLTIK